MLTSTLKLAFFFSGEFSPIPFPLDGASAGPFPDTAPVLENWNRSDMLCSGLNDGTYGAASN